MTRRRAAAEPEVEGCRTEQLSEVGNCRVQRCSHGFVHVTVGGVSLRLHPSVASHLAMALAEAAERLEHEPFASERVLC